MTFDAMKELTPKEAIQAIITEAARKGTDALIPAALLRAACYPPRPEPSPGWGREPVPRDFPIKFQMHDGRKAELTRNKLIVEGEVLGPDDLVPPPPGAPLPWLTAPVKDLVLDAAERRRKLTEPDRIIELPDLWAERLRGWPEE